MHDRSNSTQTLIKDAYGKILTMISESKLKPSEFISHRNLAEELKISKQPVSMALQWLERDGVVKSTPRVGTRIKHVTAEDMWGMLQWRIGLEVRTVVLACKYGSKENIERLLEQAKELDSLIGRKDVPVKKIYRKEMDFHLLIADMSACERLRQELDKLNIYYLKNSLCEAVRITRQETPLKAAVSHRKIVEAIIAGNSHSAAELMEKHLEQSSDMKKFVEWYKNNNTPLGRNKID
jgi:DNA-binding GntR family transcriptional regulator